LGNFFLHHFLYSNLLYFLAADEAKSNADPKVCVDSMLNRLVKQKDLDQDHFRVGLTKVFFKAGVVAHIEDLRDKRLGTLISAFQAVCRWYYAKVCCDCKKTWDFFK
jgi:myosin protein heavy chain